MSTTHEDFYSSEYTMTNEELKEVEEIAEAYEKFIANEMEANPPEIGYCGFPCDGCCQECKGSGMYDGADE